LQNRIRLLIRVTQAVREAWPESLPLFVRISATDWKDGGWNLEQSIELSQHFKGLGVDLVDVSSGGAVPHVKIPIGPGYQVEFSEAIRKETGIATGAVGMITEPAQADTILSSEQADMVFLRHLNTPAPGETSWWPIFRSAFLSCVGGALRGGPPTTIPRGAAVDSFLCASGLAGPPRYYSSSFIFALW
jgi:hypothetical protein